MKQASKSPTPKLTVIDSQEGVATLINYLQDKEFISYDCETTGVHQGAEVIGVSVCAEEGEAFYVILKAWHEGALHDLSIDVTSLLTQLQSKQLLMHNAIFDCMMAERYFKISLIQAVHTDTMVLAHLIDENRRIGLKELGTSLLGLGDDAKAEMQEMKDSIVANGGAITKTNYELYKGDAYLIGKYGAKDAWLTYMLFLELVPQLEEEGLYDFFYKDESMPMLRTVTYDLNMTGLKVDMDALNNLKKQLEAECAEAKAFILNEVAPHIKDKYPGTNKKNHFNIGSATQLSWLLFGVLEAEFGTLTKEGKAVCKSLGLKGTYTMPAKREFIRVCQDNVGAVYKPGGVVNGRKVSAKKFKEPWGYIACDKKVLTKLAPKFKWVEKLLEFQRKNKILTTYVKGIGERVNYGIIHPSFLQTGTTSGRYSSRNPNFQNLPRDDKRVKACIVARPGKAFVGADQSQLEPRVFAYYSGDEKLKKAFDGTSDFYSVIGMEVYGKYDCTPQKEGSPDAFGIKYKKLRDLSKVIALASTYGATARQLMQTTGKNEEATQADIDSYFENFPGVASFMTDSHELAKKQGFVSNIFGRKRRIPEAKQIPKLFGNLSHGELDYEWRGFLNLAVNHQIQATGASIMNRAAIRFYALAKQVGVDCHIVVQVHDSLIIECNTQDAETVSLLLEEAMTNTVKLEGVDLEAKPLIGQNLSKV